MPETLTDAKKQVWKFTQIDQSDTERPDLKAYVITNTDCKVLVAKDGTNAFSDEPTKPGDTVKPNKPDAGNKQPGLSKTGASVSGVFGAFAALLAVGAGAALAARRRREPRR
ncbi:hypothetical protein [Bifidobacterium bifidum]|uniref:hypothetical protein n=1 Tax=Bifidobacterium bifidum TaxID=1681 RepID=UPI0020B20CDF|nr:hypothetical protein [Bifidobacterium bifidum]